MHTKEKQFQQIWFAHEWVGGRKPNDSGSSRFQDGFPAEHISLVRHFVDDRKQVNRVGITTIFEEGTHITALAWNPNQHCAGFAAAGMGCGLIRIEDLAL